MLVRNCYVEPVGEAADRELLERVPEAVGVLVIDNKGMLHPFSLSTAEVAKFISDDDFPIATTAINRIDALSVVAYKGSNCILVKSYGDAIILCY